MKTLEEQYKARQSKMDEQDAIVALAISEDREITAEEEVSADALTVEIKEIQASVDKLEKMKAIQDLAANSRKEIHTPTQVIDAVINTDEVAGSAESSLEKMAAEAFSFSNLRSFKGPNAKRDAFAFGHCALAALGNNKSKQLCADWGYDIQAAGNEGTNIEGAFLVNPQFDNTFIDLKNTYGVMRQEAMMKQMSSSTLAVNVREGGLNGYWEGEADSGAESSKTWGKVNLIAKKLMAMSVWSSELNEDAVISIGDDLANEIAYAFSYSEDLAGFIGDGTSTYGGITGLQAAVTAATAGISTGASGTNASWAGIVIADFAEMVQKVQSYALPNAKWYCSRPFKAGVMDRLAFAAGGNTTAEWAAGALPNFNGYPVVTSEVLPTSADTAEVVCFFGDMRQVAIFGDRRSNTIAFSNNTVVNNISMFETDQLAIRGTSRVDINIGRVGNTTTSGSMTGLLTSA